jgi:Uma2 family endonuclease
MTAIPFHREIEYPESDGEPMAETEFHLDETIYLIEALRERFRSEPDVYVNGNLFLYFVPGNPRSVVSPDVFVVKGVAKRKRRVYKAWEEGGRVPCLIVEVTSDSTRNEDVARKKAAYERLGVEEYLLYDPLGDYLDPRLQGFRLAAGRYEKIQPAADGSLLSRTAGVTFRREGDRIRLVATASGEPFLRYEESVAQNRRHAEARRGLEDEVARLRAELERARKTD